MAVAVAVFLAIAVAVCRPSPEAVAVCVGCEACGDVVDVAVAFALTTPVAVADALYLCPKKPRMCYTGVFPITTTLI